MIRRAILMLRIIAGLGFASWPPASAQPIQRPSVPEYLDGGKVPAFAEPLLRVMGDRLVRPGKERLVINGTLSDAGGVRAIRFISEIPMKARIEDFAGMGATVTLDVEGRVQSSKGSASDSDLDLLETLALDRAEGILYSLAQGNAGRFLGRGFRPARGLGKQYRGPVYDIVDVTAPTLFRTEKPERFRRCYFDSATGLLLKVQYEQVRDGRTVKVETVFGGWGEVDGQQVPRVIERLEDGQTAFTFQATALGLTGKANDGVFGK